jgi:hypothetical protein
MTSRDVAPKKQKLANPAMGFLGLRADTRIPADVPNQVNHSNQESLKQHARMADRKAASIISGAACVDPKMVWVTLEGGGDWFDKKDETRLMAVAWDTLEKDENLGESVMQRTGDSSGRAADRDANRLEHITAVLKQYRRQQLSMHVQSISPAAEECMAGLVMDLMVYYTRFNDMKDPKITQKNQERNPLIEHEDKIRRIARILRRLPVARNQFCRTAGCILAYKLCLQEGSACTTRRLNQVQLDMFRSKASWVRFMNDNFEEIFSDVNSVFDVEDSIYIYDWTTVEMCKLDTDQFGVIAATAVPVDADTVEPPPGAFAFYT